MLFSMSQCKYQKPHQKTNTNICFFSLGGRVGYRQLNIVGMYIAIDTK